MKRVGAAVGVLVLLVGVALVHPLGTQLTLTIYLRSAGGLYAGSDVRVLGVRVGEVRRITPRGADVRVELSYDPRFPAPADAVAVVVQPTLVGERYVQLAPAYRGGPVLADGAELPLTRTATPVEPDEVLGALDDLGTALGPQGANSRGALSRLVTTGRRNLDGNGEALGRTVRDVSQLARAAAGGSGDLAETIRDLEKVTGALAASDGRVRDFATDLANVGRQLDDSKADLATAVRTLTVALAQLAAFVRENATSLRTNVRALTALSAVLVRQKAALTEFLDVAPTAIANLQRAYDPATGSLAVRAADEPNPVAAICAVTVCHPGRTLFRAPAPGSPPAPAPSAGLDRTLGGILKEPTP